MVDGEKWVYLPILLPPIERAVEMHRPGMVSTLRKANGQLTLGKARTKRSGRTCSGYPKTVRKRQ